MQIITELKSIVRLNQFHTNTFGSITIRPILFSIETEKLGTETKLWINGFEILDYIWECLCPEIRRVECSTRYPFELWGSEFSDIVKYIKYRDKNGYGIGTVDEMYNTLIAGN